MCFIFILVVFPAAKRARKNTLGLNKDSTKANFKSKEFWIARLVSIIGGALYMPIMKNLMEPFACNFNTKPWAIYKDSTNLCWELNHFLYIGMSVLGMFIYYPLATFMFSNL
jgi:hypothetical protein